MSDKVRMDWITVALAVLWGFLVLAINIDQWLDRRRDEIRAALPTSYWFRAGEITVADAGPGECPAMTFDRDINQPFRAEWTVTIMVQKSDGGWETGQTFRGGNDYRPGNSLPDDLNLCWWAWVDDPELLGLEPGRVFRVNTLWVLDTGDGSTRNVRRSSPPFTVSAF